MFRIVGRSAKLMIASIIVQQFISASSTFFLAELVTELHDGGTLAFGYLIAYFGTLVLPYLPGALVLLYLAKAKVQAQVDYINAFVTVKQGHIEEWSHKEKQAESTSILSSEMPQTINLCLDYIWYIATATSNTILNLTAIAIVVEPGLLWSYMLGLAMSMTVLYLQKPKKVRLSEAAQKSRLSWTGILLKKWDNVLLNNALNFRLWRSRCDDAHTKLVNTAVALESYNQIVSLIMTLLLLSPSFVLLTYLAYERQYNTEWLAILTVSLPRLFLLMAASFDLLFYTSDYPAQKQRLKRIRKELEVPHITPDALAHRIHWDKLEARAILEQLLEAVPPTGRFTVRGDNGSGKSSFLLTLKQRYAEKAYYLPAKSHLLFESEVGAQSTGQAAIAALRELMKDSDASIFLLDEWDANLDVEAKRTVSAMIDTLASDHCVIEVRHG